MNRAAVLQSGGGQMSKFDKSLLDKGASCARGGSSPHSRQKSKQQKKKKQQKYDKNR